ncbi:chromatin modification-related protein YNG2-like [Mizuhopecten yessoensis]|nr:chromatin modification-related protein YNG2-like [Mizuhopecten yessoensis]
MKCFNKAEEMLEFATQGYTLSAALHFMGTLNLSETPTECPVHDKASYVKSIADLIMDLIYQKPNTKEILNVSLGQEDSQQSLVCICHQDLGGMKVYCSNNRCERGQWFHLDCIGLDEADVPKGKWFCSELCEEMANMKRDPKKEMLLA